MKTISADQSSALALSARVLLAIIFLLSGFGKITAPEATQGYIAAVGMPAPLLSYLAAIVIEVGGGVLLLVGFQTRYAATVLAIFTVVSALFFHRAFGDQNQMIHFLKNLAIAGGLLQVVAYGAGAFSVDGRSRKTSLGAFAAR